jgi:hypothetical protein
MSQRALGLKRDPSLIEEQREFSRYAQWFL